MRILLTMVFVLACNLYSDAQELYARYKNVEIPVCDVRFEGDTINKLHVSPRGIWDLKDIIPVFKSPTTVEKVSKPLPNLYIQPTSKVVYTSTNTEYYYEEDDKLYLAGFTEPVDFTSSGSVFYQVKGDSYLRPIGEGENMRSTLYEYTLYIPMSYAEVDKSQFKLLPENTDSMKLEILVNELTSSRKRNVRSQMGDFPGYMVKRSSKGTHDFQIKFKGDPNWYFYELEVEDLPKYFEKRIGTTPYIQYDFYQKNELIPSISYGLQSTNLSRLRMVDLADVIDVPMLRSDQHKLMIASPNPTYGDVTINLVNYPKDTYRVELFDITGKRVLNKTFGLTANNVFKMDLSNLRKGVYLYKCIDSKGRWTTTQRIVKTDI